MNHESSRNTEHPDLGLEGDLEAIAERMRAVTVGEAPAELESALLEDLHRALASDEVDGGEADTDRRAGPWRARQDGVDGSPWRRWTRAPGLRVAAALVVLIGFSALLLRNGFLDEQTDRIGAEPVGLEQRASKRGPQPEGRAEPAATNASTISGTAPAAPMNDTDATGTAPDPSRRILAAPTPRRASSVANESVEQSERVWADERPPSNPEPANTVEERLTVTAKTPPLEQRSLSRGTEVSSSEAEQPPTLGTQGERRESSPREGVEVTFRGGSPRPGAVDGELSDEISSNAEAEQMRQRRQLEPLGYVGSQPARDADPSRPADRRGVLEQKVEAVAQGMDDDELGGRRVGGAAGTDRDSDRIFLEERAREVPKHPRVHVDRFDAMTFRDYGISPFVDTARDARSTFGLEVDTGSFNLARRYLDAGTLPPPEAIRVEEIVNALDYRDPAPRRDDFALSVEGTVSPWDASRVLLRVGVKARELEPRERPAAALTFLIDTSGSMNRENRLGLVQRSLEYLIDRLEPGDTVAIVTYGSHGRVELEPTADRERIRSVVRALRPGGSTNLEEGMRMAYEIAGRRAGRGVVSRVILCSDGVANVGLTDPEGLLRSVAEWGARGVELTAVGVGLGNYNDEMLERLAGRGDGRYAYVDQLDEARRLFVEDLTGTLFTVGRDARVQVTFDPDQVSRYRLVGYENRAIPDHRFRDRRTDGGEIGAGHAVSAVYEIELRDAAAPGWFDRIRGATLGDVALVYRRVGEGGPEPDLSELSMPIRAGVVFARFDRAPASLRLAVLAARFAEILRVSPYVEGDLGELFEQSQALVGEFRGDRRVVQLVDLIGAARDRL